MNGVYLPTTLPETNVISTLKSAKGPKRKRVIIPTIHFSGANS